MQPIQINVQVNIGVTDQVTRLVEALTAVTHPDIPAIVATGQNVAEKEEAETAPQAAEEPIATAAEQPTEEAPQAVQTTAEKEYTEADVRAAMDRTRRRIEGDNYKEKPDSESYKKWHRKMTAWFKNTANLFGAEKPSILPDSNSRRSFIEECDRVQIENDELSKPLPF